MPQVVQIQRAPNSWEQGGQSVQDTADNMIKSMLAMGQMQNNNALHMATLNLQNQRLADANARYDQRWAEQQAAQDRAFAHQDKWKQQELALQRDALGRQYAAMNKPQLVQGTDAYGRPTFGWVSPGSTAPKMIDFTGGGQQGGASTIPGLDSAAGAGVNEVLSPGWSPLSSGGQQDTGSMYDNGVRAGLLKPLPPMSGFGGGVDTPSPVAPIPTQAEVQLSPITLDAPKPANPLYELGQRAGIFPQTPLVKPEAPQYPDNAQPPASTSTSNQMPPVGSTPQQPAASTLAPGTVVDGSGKMVQLPDNVPWGKQEKQYVNGVEYYGARTPNGVYFKVGGPVPPTAAERKDMQAVEKNAKAEKASVSGGMTIADAALRSADESLKLLDEYGGMATGTRAQGWLGEGTMGRKLGFGQGMADLHRAMQPMQTASMMEMIKEMKDQSPSGALNMRITQLEAVMLSGILGSLELDQNPDQLRKNILAHKEIYQQTMQAMTDLAKEKGYPVPGYIADRYGMGQQQPGGSSAQLPAGFRLVN